ncbi:hypothetical protein RRF57_013326 [Xylaria bambusicola]|uniref:Uncharacterized protein n=1 Tax=Xylaria bambusicola TaxID=326684 RepID=A0AAN7ZE92_9PEZI
MDSPTNDDHDDLWSPPLDAGGRATKRRRTTDGERGVMRDSKESGLPHFIGSGSGIHLIRTVYDVLARAHTDHSRTPHGAAADLVSGEEDPSTSGLHTRGSVPTSPFWQSEEVAGSAAAHPIFPFLHGPAFLGVLEQVGEHGIKALNQADAIVVRSLLSISPNNISASLNFVLSSPAFISNIQAALCMASRNGGIIVRMPFNLGLHRCPSRYPNFNAHDAWANEVYDLTNTNPLSRTSLIGGPNEGECDTSDNYISSSYRVLLIILQATSCVRFRHTIFSSCLPGMRQCIKGYIYTTTSNSLGCEGNEMHLKHSFLLWLSLTWSIWMSCFALTYAAMKRITTPIYANRELRVFKFLSLRQTLWPDRCILAVEQLISFLAQVCINEKQSIATAPRNQKRPQSKYSTKTTGIPATSSQPLNPNTSREDRRCSRPRQPRLDNKGALNWRSQDITSSAGASLPATADTQDYSSSNFSEFFPNVTYDYTNMLGMADPLGPRFCELCPGSGYPRHDRV